MANNKNTINSATKWSILGELLAKMIAPITTMVLARIIDIKSFGILASITMIISLSDSIVNMGFRRVIVQLDFDNEDEEKICANVCFFINLIFSLSLWIFIILFRTSLVDFLGISGKELELIVAGVILPISALSSIQEGIYIKLLDYKVLFYTRVITVIIPLLVTIPIAIITRNYWALLIGNIVIITVKAVYLTYKSIWKPKFYISKNMVLGIYKLASMNILDAIVFWMTSWLDLFLVTKLYGIYYSGMYKTGQSLVASIISLLTAGVTSVAFSSFSLYKKDAEKFNSLFYNFQKGLSIFVMPLGIGIFLYRDLIVTILLGEKWFSVAYLVGIWGFVISMIAIYGTFCREAYRAVEKPQISLYVQLIHFLFLIPIFIWISHLQYNDFVLIRSLAFLQILFVHSYYMKKLFNISLLKMLVNTKYNIFSSILMGGFGYICILNTKNFVFRFISVFLCIIIYFVVLFLNKKYRDIVFNFIKNYRKRS